MMRPHALAVALALTVFGVARHSFAQCVTVLYPQNTAGAIGFNSSTYIPESLIDAAIGEWGTCSTAGTGFPEMRSDAVSDITIDVVLQPGQSTTAAGGCGEFRPQTDASGAITGGTIVVFDSDILGHDCEPIRANTIAHEMGHVLGLANSGCDGYIMSASWNRSVQPDECSTVDNQWTTPAEQPPSDPYCDAYCWTSCDSYGCPSQPPCFCSPILIDLDDNGFDLTGLDDAVDFDIDADGSPDRISWTSSEGSDAFLALDRNDNGRIDDGSELCGSSTLLTTGERALNGYLALAELDRTVLGGNGDGVIDSHDAVWTDLRMWIDADHDGKTGAGELLGLSAAGVSEIATRYTRSNRSDHNGNVYRFKSKATVRDKHGREHRTNTYDVFFAMSH